MTRGQRSRIAARRKHRRQSRRPDNFDSLTPLERLTWLAEHGGFEQAVAEANAEWRAERQAEAAERAIAEAQKTLRAPEPAAAVESPRALVETKPAPPPRPRHAGEADPAFVPPQNQFWEERCRFRARGPNEPYDDDPPEQDELDELIYGSE